MITKQHFTVEVDVSGKAIFVVEATDRKEAETIVKNMQNPNSENYNQFWGYIFDAVQYNIAGIHRANP